MMRTYDLAENALMIWRQGENEGKGFWVKRADAEKRIKDETARADKAERLCEKYARRVIDAQHVIPTKERHPITSKKKAGR